MTDTTRASTWHDRWVWVVLAVATLLVFVAIAATSWWQSHQRGEEIENRYVCAITIDNGGSAEDC